MLKPVFPINHGFCTVSLKNKNEEAIKSSQTHMHLPSESMVVQRGKIVGEHPLFLRPLVPAARACLRAFPGEECFYWLHINQENKH